MEYNKSGCQKRATVVGPLAEKISKLKLGETMSCLMVKDGDTYKIMAPEDLPICTRNVIQQMLIPYSDPFIVLGDRLTELHGSVVYQIDEDSVLRAMKVRDCVTIKYESEKHISLNWDAGQISDIISTSILSNLISLNQEKLDNMNYVSDSLSWEARKQKNKDKAIHDILLSLFGVVKLEDEKFVIMVENNVAYIDKESGDVESENEGLKERFTKLYKQIRNHVAVLNNSYLCLMMSPWIPSTIWEDDGTTVKMEAEIALSREDQSAFRQDSS
ncbi:cleavage and polyadenylation specificity factor subunit 3-I-like [Silene latifolia]|uniref:cleavage and polyadenylation specificity factor subunit 3-I-like n=1 Tax=Silene latifolia TaxID=37657 RepID=UPI003D784309